MYSFKLIYFVIFILNLYKTNGEISDQRLCVDPGCTEPVSLARTLLRYSSHDPKILSFAPNANVKIFSKDAGSKSDLWGVEINGKRGYAPKSLLREYKMLKKPTILVDTEVNNKPKVPSDGGKDSVVPDKVKDIEVIDGTTIYLGDSISPSSTESPVVLTALPQGSNEVTEKTEPLQSVSTEVPAEPTQEKENNIFSSISNWLKEDENSEETDDDLGEEDFEEEIEDGDEEKEDEESEKSIPNVPNLKEEIQSSDTISASKEDIDVKNVPIQKEDIQSNDTVSVEKEDLASDEDINKLTNLPPDVKISTYNLEMKENNETADKLTAEPEKPKEDKVENLVASKNPKEDNFLPTVEPLVEEKIKSEPVTTESKENTNKQKTEQQNINEDKNEDIKTQPEDLVKAEEKVEIKKTETTKIPVTTKEASIEDDLMPPTLDEVTPDPLDAQKIQETLTEDVQQLNDTVEETKISASSPKQPAVEKVEQKQEDVSQAKFQNEENKGPSFSPFSLFDKIQEEIQKPDTEERAVVKSAEEDEEKKEENLVEKQKIEDKVPESFSSFNLFNTVPEEIEHLEIKEDKFETKAEDHKEEIGSDVNLNKVTEEIQQEENRVEEAVDSEAPNAEEVSIEDEEKATKNETEEKEINEETQEESGGFLSGVMSFFGGTKAKESSSAENIEELSAKLEESHNNAWTQPQHNEAEEILASKEDCGIKGCPSKEDVIVPQKEQNVGSLQEDIKAQEESSSPLDMQLNFNYDFFVYLVTTAASTLLFLLGYLALDKRKKEIPLIARINKLEQQLLIATKENELLQENKPIEIVQPVDNSSNELVEELTQRLAEMQIAKSALEEQVQALEKELDISTDVGMELNRIVSEMLTSTSGSDTLKASVEQMQRQLLEQQDTINTINETLSLKETENHELNLELDISNKKVLDLQTEVEKMLEKNLKLKEERDQQQGTLEQEVVVYQQKYKEATSCSEHLNIQIDVLKTELAESRRQVEIKVKEYKVLKDSIQEIKSGKNNWNNVKSLLEVSSIKAELDQLQIENKKFGEELREEREAKMTFEKRCLELLEEVNEFRGKYEKADKEKVEINTKLDVLNNYFKEKEAQMQKEITKYESVWAAKEGEATSTTERIKYMQGELQNFKAQNESLKQEIINQEVELKSQISMLEKKVHENWVTNRQIERKLEDARQEAAQLRNRLTMRERAINEGNLQNRLQSPIQNGDHPLSPPPLIESPASPLLYGGRDHITKSPPLPGLPPHFLPPPPGAPFMPPPPHGLPPFLPPPPSMFPGDHRPPPLGRMSSPPLNSRYSPESTVYSGYDDRRSPSPTYDSEYGASPPPIRGYSPYRDRDDRRDYKRPHVRSNGRIKASALSSGSEQSNDSLDKVSRKPSKKV